MPVFEIQRGNEVFEVEAPDLQSAANALTDNTSLSIRNFRNEETLAPQQAPPVRQAPEAPGAFDAFQRSAGDRFLNNVLSLPDVAAAGIANLPSPMNFIQPMTGGGFRNETLLEDVTGVEAPRVGERVLPTPRMEDIRAVTEVAIGEAGSLEESRQAQREFAEQSPTATMLGQMFGDAATIFTGRAPFQAAARRATPAAASRQFHPGLRNQIDRIVKSKISSGLGRGFKRAAETGLEGASLAVLNEGNPGEVAAYAAGGHMATSLALTLAKHPIKGLAPAVLATTAAIHLTKSAVPGGNNFVLPSIEEAFAHTVHILGLGLVAGLAGGGRLSNTSLSKNLPKITDAITSLPRGAVLSLINEMTKDPDAQKVVETYSRDPNAFGPKATRRLERAIMKEKVSLSDTVTEIMRDQRFRAVFETVPATQR